MNTLKKLLRDRRYRIASILLLIWIIDLYHFGPRYAGESVVISVLSACILDFLINQFFRKLTYFPISGLVSGLLVGLIISPSVGYTTILAAAILAVLSKHLLTWKQSGLRRHIFNPAAFGVILVSVFFGNQAAWWSVAWWSHFYIVLVPLAGYVIYTLGRLTLVASFLGIYFLYSLVNLVNPLTSLIAILDSTMLMFAFIMLPEPQSSPASGVWKYGFGVLVGLIVILIGFWKGLSLDPLLTSLLLANGISFVLNALLPRLTK